MEILMVAPRAFPYLGGVEKHIHELSKELVNKGHNVTVVTHKDDESIQDSVLDGVSYKYFMLPMNNFYSISKQLVEFVKTNVSKYDAIHLQAIHKPLAVYMIYVLKKTNANLIFTPHYHGGGHTKIANMAHYLYRVVVRLVISRINHVIAVSDSEAELLKTDFPAISNRVEVIPNGIVPPAKAKPFKKEKPVILSVSRVEPYKRIDTVIKSLPEGVQLVVVGEGDDLTRLKQIASDNSADVVFTGRVNNEELNGWWHTADIFVSLSEKEAYGLTLGEAMSIGLPSIISDIPAYRFVYNLAGKPSNVEFFKDKVSFGEQVKGLLADKGKGSKKTAFTWQEAAVKTEMLYKEKDEDN